MRILVAAAALLLLARPALAEGDLYAAIAYSQASKAVGIAKDKTSREEAEQAASASCGVSSCKATYAKNACLALAVATDGAWATEWGVDLPDASQKAVAGCGKYTKSSCKVRTTACVSGTELPQTADSKVCRDGQSPPDERIRSCTAMRSAKDATAGTKRIALSNRADAWESMGDYARAIADYTEALSFDPKSFKLFSDRGRAFLRSKLFPRALADFEQAIAIDPQSSVAWRNRANARMQLEDNDGALADSTKAIQLDPKNVEAFRIRATTYFLKRDYEHALADANSAIAIDPKNAESHARLGFLCWTKNDYDCSIHSYDEALRLDPTNAEAFASRGKSYKEKGDLDRAIADYDQALRLDPKDADTFSLRGDAYDSKHDFDRALTDFDKAIEINPKYANAYNSRCWLRATKNRDLPLALSDCDSAVRLSPDDANILDSRGFVYLRLKRLDEAIADYDAALKLDPKMAASLYGRGLAKLGKGDDAGATADINLAKAIRPAVADDFSKYGVVGANSSATSRIISGISGLFGRAKPEPSGQAEIKIGVTGPFTGPASTSGSQLKNGAELAVEDINAAGGILGQKIVLNYGDDAADLAKGNEVAQKFAKDGVKFVVGPFNSGVAVPTSDTYHSNNIVVVAPSATNPKITERGLWNVFRTCGRDDQQGPVAASYVLTKFRGKKIAIVHDETSYGRGLAADFKKALNDGGMQDVLYEEVNYGKKDYSPLVSKIKASAADLVYWGGLHTEAALIVRQMRDRKIKAPLMSGDGIAIDEFASAGGSAIEGTLMTFPPDPLKRPEAAGIVAKFRARKLEPDGYTLYSYAAVEVIKQAAEQAKSLEPRKVADVIHSGRKFATVLGELSYDQKGDVTRPDYVVYAWKKQPDGKITYVEEQQSASAGNDRNTAVAQPTSPTVEQATSKPGAQGAPELPSFPGCTTLKPKTGHNEKNAVLFADKNSNAARSAARQALTADGWKIKTDQAVSGPDFSSFLLLVQVHSADIVVLCAPSNDAFVKQGREFEIFP